MTAESLQELRKKIDKAKSEKARAEGAIEQIEKQWKDDFDCDGVDAVKKLIDDTREQIDSLSKKLESYIREITDKLPNNGSTA